MIAPVTQAGMGVWLQNVCKILEKNHEITLLTSNLPGVKIFCNNTISLDSWNFPNPLYCYMPKLKNLLKSGFFNNFDVIHLHGFSIYATDFILKHAKEISPPIFLSVHGNLQNQKMNILKKIHDVYALRFKTKISHVFAVSNAEKNILIKLGFNESKITVAYNGVKIENIERTSPQKIILYIGRLAPTKNIELLINAFSCIRFNDYDLIIAGKDFGSMKNLKNLSKKLNLKTRVFFLGEISEEKRRSLLSETSIFIHPSISDIFSLTLLEAASVGVPCIAFDVEGINEIFSQKNTGILIPPNDIKSMTNSIDLLLSNGPFYKEISYNCKEFIPKKFSWNKTVEIIEKIYNTI
jgi:glycosyltransferase involved in cell wall biosynthesis